MARWSCFGKAVIRLTAVFAFLTSGALSSVAVAEDPPVTRVEEDWVVLIDVPNPLQNAPQITSVMSPVGNADGIHFAFALNHRSLPDYTAGGLQLQCWSDEFWIGYRDGTNGGVCMVDQEQISYTLRMNIDEQKMLSVAVLNGQSQTWGQFGDTGPLRYEVQVGFENLDDYSPEVTVANSRVGFAANRVKKFQIKEIRYYSGETLVKRDTTGRIIHELFK